MKCDKHACGKNTKWFIQWGFGNMNYKTWRCSKHAHEVLETLRKFGISNVVATPFPTPEKVIFT